MTTSVGLTILFSVAALICAALSFADKPKLHQVATILLAIAVILLGAIGRT